MIIRNGLQGGATKEQTKRILGKNLGKANVTSPEEQCILECAAKHQKKLDEQYVDKLSAVEDYTQKEILLPMLAQKFTERKHKIQWPAWVQPKLNGVRCLNQELRFLSRQGKEFTTLNHLLEEVVQLNKLGIEIPDGEIYIHGASFQEIIRLVKKERENEANKALEYWIYDCINTDNFLERKTALDRAFMKGHFKHLRLVPSYPIQDEQTMKVFHDRWVQEGYEGAIIRNADGLYQVKHRSNDLQKYKVFHDEEFRIVGFDQGAGIEDGCIIFVCVNKEGKQFSVRPKGSHDLRKAWYKKGKSFLGKDLTVRYQNLSEASVPIFPSGITVRDYE